MAGRDFNFNITGDSANGVAALDTFASKLKRTFDDGQSQAASFKSVFAGSFLGNIAANFASDAAAAVGDFFAGSRDQASDLNETLSAATVIFGDQAATIAAWGDTAAASFGLSKQAAVEAAVGFGDMFLQLGFTGEAAAQNSQDIVQMAADLGSFRNLDTSQVLDMISASMRGEYDSLQRVIPNINAARVETEALAMTGKTAASELTAQERATATLAIIQQDGARAAGDFARTQDGAANQSKVLTAEMQNQQAALGQQLLPIFTTFQSFLITNVVPALSSVIRWVSENGTTVALLAGTIGLAAAAYFGINAALGLHAAFAAAAARAQGVLTVGQWALNAAMSANPIMLIVIAIAALVAAIIWVATQTTFFQDLWTNVTAVVGAAWTWLWTNVLQPVFAAIGVIFTWLWENIIYPVVVGIMLYIGLWAAIITWLWDAVISPVFGFIGTIFTWLYQNVIIPVVGLIIATVQAWAQVFTWLWENIVNPVFQSLAAGFNWIWGNVVSPVVGFITGAIQTIGSTVSSVFGGIADFIGSAFNAALNVVRGPLNGIIGLVNSAIMGINSLSVTIPDWVPIVGGQMWGLDLPTIPRLATGTVTNGPMLAVIGDNPGGREVVSPLDRYENELRLAYTAGQQQSSTAGRQEITLVLTGSPELLAQIVDAQIESADGRRVLVRKMGKQAYV